MTAPLVQGCPASFSDKTNSLQKHVTWTPPTFTDNVGVASVLSNRQPGFEMKTYTSLTIRYTATDAAGNVAYCLFNITLEGRWYLEPLCFNTWVVCFPVLVFFHFLLRSLSLCRPSFLLFHLISLISNFYSSLPSSLSATLCFLPVLLPLYLPTFPLCLLLFLHCTSSPACILSFLSIWLHFSLP